MWLWIQCMLSGGEGLAQENNRWSVWDLNSRLRITRQTCLQPLYSAPHILIKMYMSTQTTAKCLLVLTHYFQFNEGSLWKSVLQLHLTACIHMLWYCFFFLLSAFLFVIPFKTVFSYAMFFVRGIGFLNKEKMSICFCWKRNIRKLEDSCILKQGRKFDDKPVKEWWLKESIAVTVLSQVVIITVIVRKKNSGEKHRGLSQPIWTKNIAHYS